MNKSKLSNAVLYVSLLAFIVFTFYILYINQEVFYTAHERSEFIYGEPFFQRMMSKPFGLMQYVGAWLTQFFYHPALGTSLLVAIWVLIFLAGVKAFSLKKGAIALMLLPVACLLTSVVDQGYWIYISTIRGYWFSQSLGYLVMLLWLWVARSSPRKWHLFWYLLGVCAYPVLGWFALLFVLCLVLSESLTWREALGIILLLFAASVWHTQCYSNLKFDDVVLAGLPRFITPSDSAEHLSIPFWVLGALSVLLSLGRLGNWLFGRLWNWSFARLIVPVVCVVVGIIFTSSQMYYDKNYINEMRMVRYAFDGNWQEILNMAEENKQPTTTMIFLKNIALMNEGGLLNRSFKMGNNSHPICNPDTLHVTLLDIASPLVYYNYGMINEAVRLGYENAIQAGFSPFYLKMLSRCALAQEDKQLLERYTALLHHHPFYANWQPAPVTEKVKELQTSYPDELTGIENSDSYIVNNISYWYETEDKLVSEQALFYSMIRCDSRRFWASLRNFVRLHMNEEFPLHAQEAYILYMDKAPEKKRMMIPIERKNYERYQQFWRVLETHVKPGMTLEKVGEQMREEWGDTYWWFNIFGRKPYIINSKIGNEVHS